MKNVSTHFLRLALVGLAGLALLFSILIIPAIYSEWGLLFPDIERLKYMIIGGLLVAAAMFYVALYQAFLLLGYIDANKAFSALSVRALDRIKYCGILVAFAFLLEMPMFYMVAEIDDAPGLIVIGMLFVAAPVVVSVFAAVMQKLVQSAIDIKTENELTV